MAYVKNVWEDRAVEFPRRFDELRDEEGHVTLIPAPGTVAQEGTGINAERLNHMEEGIANAMTAEAGEQMMQEVAGKASTAGYTATLLGAGWSAGVPHTQTVAVEGILATDNPFVDVDMSGATTGAAGTALSDAWTLVGRVEAGAGSITAYCYDDAPAVDIPLILKVVR